MFVRFSASRRDAANVKSILAVREIQLRLRQSLAARLVVRSRPVNSHGHPPQRVGRGYKLFSVGLCSLHLRLNLDPKASLAAWSSFDVRNSIVNFGILVTALSVPFVASANCQ